MHSGGFVHGQALQKTVPVPQAHPRALTLLRKRYWSEWLMYLKYSKREIQEFPLCYALKCFLLPWALAKVGVTYKGGKPCLPFWKPSNSARHHLNRPHLSTSCVRYRLLPVGGARRTFKPPPALKFGASLGSKLQTGSLCVSHKSLLNGPHKWLKWLFCKRQDLKSCSRASPLRTLFVDWRSTLRNTQVIT